MKRIVIILIGLISVAYGQSSPTSAKVRYVNGLYVGTKLDSYFAAADSNAIYWRADSALMAKYKGAARALAFAVSGGYIPYSDTTSLFSQVVRTFGTQTVGGNKTFSNDLSVNGLTVGRGGGLVSTNSAFGPSALLSNTTGAGNTAIGNASLLVNTTSSNNTGVGRSTLVATTGAQNTALGAFAGGNLTTGSNNTYIGYFTPSSGVAVSNETVIGASATGNGSNTVTIGNSSVVGNYFNGFLKQTSVTSSVLKADASGVVSAAVAGDITSLISGTYLPLSGGTMTGQLIMGSGNNVQLAGGDLYYNNNAGFGILSQNSTRVLGVTNSGVSIPNITGNTSSTGTFAATAVSGNSFSAQYNAGSGSGSLGVGRWLTQPESSTITRTYFTGSDASTYGRWEIYRATSTTPAIIHQYNADGSQQMYGALNGTSLSMSGLGEYGGTIRATGATGGLTTGSGVEIRNNSGTGEVFTYNRATAAYLPTRIDGSTLALNTLTSGAITLGGSLSGTSLSMSGLATVQRLLTTPYNSTAPSGAISDYNLGISAGLYGLYTGVQGSGVAWMQVGRTDSNTPYDLLIQPNGGSILMAGASADGTNKLIVNGGVKGSVINSTGIITTPSGSAGGLLYYDYGASGSSRSWRTLNDVAANGDFAIQQSTTRTGSTYADALYFSPSLAATFSSSVTASSFVKSGGTSTQALIADGSVQTLTSGTYTPTLTGITNVTSTNATACYWKRVGNVVTVSGFFGVTATTNAYTELTISLPVASSLSTYSELSGNGLYYYGTLNLTNGLVVAGTNIASFRLPSAPNSGANTNVQFSFTYIVQ